MENVYDLTASQWLTLPDHEVTALFPAQQAERQKVCRQLAQRWHPDRNADTRASEVFMRIQRLASTLRPARGNQAAVEIVSSDGRTFHYQATHSEDHALGRFHRATATLAYQVLPAHRALFDNATLRIGGLGYANPAMRKSLSVLLPNIVGSVWGKEGGLLVLRKPVDAIRLRDLLVFTGQLDPRHVAWILSGLFNLACYLENQRLAHHDIGLDTVWIRPACHEVLLLGGWFFASPYDTNLSALPSHAAQLASPRYLSARRAGPGLDTELVRAVGRELLGDRMGQRLSAAVPPAMKRFLTDPPATTALEDYRGWKQALEASFGPPTFVPMPFSASDIYKENHHG